MSSTFLIKQGPCFTSLKNFAGSRLLVETRFLTAGIPFIVSGKQSAIRPLRPASVIGVLGKLFANPIGQSISRKLSGVSIISKESGLSERRAITAPNASSDMDGAGSIGTPRNKPMKYIVVTGGVVSGLGKGVTASSIGVVLNACGLRATSIKIGKGSFLECSHLGCLWKAKEI
jgi:hypothetical protein